MIHRGTTKASEGMKLVLGDIIFPFMAKARKGESIWQALRRQGREVRRERRKALRKALRYERDYVR